MAHYNLPMIPANLSAFCTLMTLHTLEWTSSSTNQDYPFLLHFSCLLVIPVIVSVLLFHSSANFSVIRDLTQSPRFSRIIAMALTLLQYFRGRIPSDPIDLKTPSFSKGRKRSCLSSPVCCHKKKLQ